MKALYIEKTTGKEVELLINTETERAVKLGIYTFVRSTEVKKEDKKGKK